MVMRLFASLCTTITLSKKNKSMELKHESDVIKKLIAVFPDPLQPLAMALLIFDRQDNADTPIPKFTLRTDTKRDNRGDVTRVITWMGINGVETQVSLDFANMLINMKLVKEIN